MDVPLGEQIEEPLTKSQKKARKALARAALAEAEQEEDEVEPSPFGEEGVEEADGISPFGEEAEPSPFDEEEASPFDPESEVELEMEVVGETEAVKEKVKKIKTQKAKVEVIAPATLANASFDGKLSFFSSLYSRDSINDHLTNNASREITPSLVASSAPPSTLSSTT